MPLDMKERSSVWCPEIVCDSFPTGPVGSLFLWVFNATSTSFVKPGQLKVPAGQQTIIIWHLTVLKSSYMLIRRYFKKKKGSYCGGKLGKGRPNATTGRKGVTMMASTVQEEGNEKKIKIGEIIVYNMITVFLFINTIFCQMNLRVIPLSTSG